MGCIPFALSSFDQHTTTPNTRSSNAFQGLPEGHTKPCWPLAGSNIGGHRLARAKDVDAEVAASKRWDLLGNAVTVPVARWLGERLAAPYVYKFHTGSVGNRRMDHLLNEGVPQIEPQRSARRLAVPDCVQQFWPSIDQI